MLGFSRGMKPFYSVHTSNSHDSAIKPPLSPGPGFYSLKSLRKVIYILLFIEVLITNYIVIKNQLQD